ncbi:MAG: dTDP-4-dehydrorhamnose reductase [Alphaproteobacteria bacterium]|nr:dTDP-4-dehydrorhamnose reductase [Alphaproteobacteria bacterium]
MKVAVFGAAGQVGCALVRVAARRGIAVAAFDRDVADVTDVASVRTALARAGADAVVNAAAYTAVDKAESESQRAFAINRHGAANLARATSTAELPFIHLSTDYVFDGTKSSTYTEDDPIAPLGAYGRSKAEGESAVLASTPNATILRTAWVYGLEGANFVKTMLRLGAERDTLRVVNDQHGSPTFADDLADAILTIATTPQAGIYHVTGQGEATWFEFATAIFANAARHGARVPQLVPITTADYPTPARRPANSVLSNAKVKRTFAVELPHWNDGLSRMLNAHFAGPQS